MTFEIKLRFSPDEGMWEARAHHVLYDGKVDEECLHSQKAEEIAELLEDVEGFLTRMYETL